MAHTGLAIRTRRAKPDSMDGGVILVPDSPVHKQPAEAEPQVKTKKKPRKKKKETAEQQVADGPPVHNQPPEAEPPTKTKKKQKAKKEKDEQAADGLPVGFNGRFTSEYGASFDELEPWVRLCRDLGVDRPLPSKTQCRKALADIHVNIHDFLDALDERTRAAAAAATTPHGRPAAAAILAAPVAVRCFASERALAKYTLNEGRVYSRREIRANRDNPLRLLMARILPPKAQKGAV